MAMKDVLDRMEQVHRERYASDDSQIAPFIMLLDDQEEMTTYVQLPMGDDRQATVLAIASAVLTTQSYGYVFSSEAWMAVVNREKWESGDHPMPSADPERQEVLIMEGNSFAESVMRIFAIERDSAGKVTNLRRKTDMEEGSLRMHSRFDIFPRPQHAV
jgi:hypothetical protein